MSKPTEDRGSLYAFIFFLIILIAGCMLFSCNSLHRTQAKESEIRHKDSLGTYEETSVATVDSNVVSEEKTFHFHTGDSSLDAELEITMQQQKDYANGDYDRTKGIVTADNFDSLRLAGFDFGNTIRIERTNDRIVIDPGKNRIERIRLKEAKQGSKKDSVVTQSTSKADLSKKDSGSVKQSTAVSDSSVVKSVHKEVEKKKTPWYLYAIGGLVAVVIVLGITVIKKSKLFA